LLESQIIEKYIVIIDCRMKKDIFEQVLSPEKILKHYTENIAFRKE
jgi:hypothetical protein